MNSRRPYFPSVAAVLAGCLAIAVGALIPQPAGAAGVTLVTHGYSGNVNGWITGMTDQMANYTRFPGSNSTTYQITATLSGGNHFFSSARVAGQSPTNTDSGEIIVKFDWSNMAGGILSIYSTSNVAAATTLALLQTNLIAELGGRSLIEFPLHLIGHSRGGSLISELSRLLGTNGVWIDHLTTLDPHPINNDGFDDFPAGVDAPVRTYVNVLFHDNYWQNQGGTITVPNGMPVSGAYIRQLTNLSGGYSSTHSDVHLWYHATIDWRPNASDTEAALTPTQRAANGWWSTYENGGTNAGFLYSLIGGGNRLSTDRPVGPTAYMIRDGFNQWWDLGAGVMPNRTNLSSNNGAWPNLIRFNRTTTNSVAPGELLPVTFYYQWAQPDTTNATVRIYLDDDLNLLNANSRLLDEFNVPGTGAGFVNQVTRGVVLDATNAPVGQFRLYASISGGGRTRYLYAPELVQITASVMSPRLEVLPPLENEIHVVITGEPGQTLLLQQSVDLMSWQPLATNTLTATNRWFYLDSSAASQRFYRAVIGQ